MHWWFLFLLLPTTGQDPNDAVVISTAEMIEALTTQQQQLEDLVIEFEVEQSYGAAATTPPPGAPTAEHLVVRTQNSALIQGYKYRLEREYLATYDVVAELIGTREILTWDGVEARSLQVRADDVNDTLIIWGEPPILHYGEREWSWLGCWVLQFNDRYRYADLLTFDQVAGPHLQPDGCTRWIVRIAPPTFVLIDGARCADRVELRRVELRAFDLNDEIADPFQEAGLAVTHLIEFESLSTRQPISTGAVMLQAHYRLDPSQSFWMHTRVTLLDVQAIEPSEDAFFVTSSAGDYSVADERYRIAYGIGRTSLNMDGRIVMTDVPVQGDSVGHEIEDWVAAGTLAPLFDPDTGEFIEPVGAESASSHRLPFMITAGLVLLMLVVSTAWRKRAARTAAVLIVCTVCLLSGCDGSASDASNVADLGRVSLNDGTVVVTHQFMLTNDSDGAVEVVGIKPSCDCVAANVGSRQLASGESTTLDLTLEVKHPGQTSHGATVVLSDDTVLHYMVTAFGTVGLELTPIVLQPGFELASKQCNIRLCLVDTDGQGEQLPPSIVSPPGVRILSDSWITLERQTEHRLRPTRQVAHATLDLSEYDGEFPVEVVIRTAVGAEGTLTIYRDESE